MALKDDIITYRALHNISQGKFAELCKVSKQTIFSIENGHQDPSKLTEAKIRLVLDNANQEVEA